MDDSAPALAQHMSPASVSAIIDDPECIAIARDLDFSMLWCNESAANHYGSSREALQGSTLADVMTAEQAEERMALMRPVARTGMMHAHQQLFWGKRWLTRVWPLDPEAFGCEGYFVLITRLTDSYELNNTDVEFVRSADLGPLSVLTRRELEVFYYLAIGMTVQDVARTLFRSEKTIGRHVENIHTKMGYTNRSMLVREAVERGLVNFTGEEWQKITDPKGTG